MTTISRRKHLITQLIRAARGQWLPAAGAESNASTVSVPPPTKLPCFPLERHHFGQLLVEHDASRNGERTGVSTGRAVRRNVASPSDFHSYLCDKIERARERIVIASLYVGVGSSNATNGASEPIVGASTCVNCKEDALLQALKHASSRNSLEKVQVLLDANRALRNVSFTNKQSQSHGSSPSHIKSNSAEAVFSKLNPFLESSPNDRSSSGLFLFPVNDKRLSTILPSPLDEVAGVFHIKAYIVDDELILSGANLSEEYFSNRLDRYMLFTNGGGGLVDFYANLCDTLCEYAIRYDGRSNTSANTNLSPLFSLKDEEARKLKLERSLLHLFDGNNPAYHQLENNHKSNPVAYAIPTFQMPTSFLGRPIRFQSDKEVIRSLLLSALKHYQSASVRLSSAYLNLTSNLLSVLTMYGGGNNAGTPYILTAGAISHGFAPKENSPNKKTPGFVDKIKATIPEAFLTLVKQAAQSIVNNGGKILLYERSGWTFHAKGIWITENDGNGHRPERIDNPSSSLLATIIGSGNYGARSEDLDVESNCILVFNDINDDNRKEGDDACPIKEYVAADWNNMCEFSNEMAEDVEVADASKKLMQVVLGFMKKYL